MKKLLLALIAIATVAVFSPAAKAGQFARVYNQHGVVYVHKSSLYSGNSYGSNCHSKSSKRYRTSYSRPSYYSRPVYYSQPRYVSSRSSCYSRSTPRISFSFGF